MRIHVAIASTGRAEVLRRVVERYGAQTRAPDGIVVVGAAPEDIEGLDRLPVPPVALVSPTKGSCPQRNVALNLLRDTSDVVIFCDDDFLPADDMIERVRELFSADPALVGATGMLIADGAHSGALTYDQAAAMLETGSQRPDRPDENTNWLYGCNMAFRVSACDGLEFDENLPLYGWQEDVDISERLARRGRMVRTPAISGIHLGMRSGRTSGLRLGYSQVANILYLRRKGTIRASHGWGLMARNVLSNLVKSLRPEPGIDRRGRLMGNITAFHDIARGRSHPTRILDF